MSQRQESLSWMSYGECLYAVCPSAECPYAECLYAECSYADFVMLVVLSLNVIMLKIDVSGVLMLKGLVLNVLAPYKYLLAKPYLQTLD